MSDGVHDPDKDETTPGTPPQSAGERCPECDGTGRRGDKECPACEGSGNVMHGFGGG
jgi:DnaJ-class molecular chaperone